MDETELRRVVSDLALRPGHEMVRALLYQLMVRGLGIEGAAINFESPVPEVRGRIDALLGRTVLELKTNLRRELGAAEAALTRYLGDRERQTGERFVGIATDGADFVAYLLRDGSAVRVDSHRTDADRPRELLAWLQGVVAVGEDLAPEPGIITREFGRESLVARRALEDLRAAWERVGRTPGGLLKRNLWGRLLGLAYGEDVGGDELFLQHTYLVIVAKAIAWTAMMNGPPTDAVALLRSAAFTEHGIGGMIESDFFDWVGDDRRGSGTVMRVWHQVDRFRLRDIEVDVLKALYESLIDPDTRHDLGEYYTPDWLAARMVAEVVDDPLHQRVMDPACGSGTFLFHAVRAVLSAGGAQGLPPGEIVRRAVGNVAGIDVHPVAVIFARVTYLLALLPALRSGHPGNFSLPVYLGDSLQWNRARTVEGNGQTELLADDDTLEISVPAIEPSAVAPVRLGPATLRFPAAVAADAQFLDRVLTTMIDMTSQNAPPPPQTSRLGCAANPGAGRPTRPSSGRPTGRCAASKPRGGTTSGAMWRGTWRGPYGCPPRPRRPMW